MQGMSHRCVSVLSALSRLAPLSVEAPALTSKQKYTHKHSTQLSSSRLVIITLHVPVEAVMCFKAHVNTPRYPMLALVFPALLLLPSGTITSWATYELTVHAQDSRTVGYKHLLQNTPTAPNPAQWLLGLASRWLMIVVMQW
jgi:hypothetical protein